MAKERCPRCKKRVDVVGSGSAAKLDFHQVKVDTPSGETWVRCPGSSTKIK